MKPRLFRSGRLIGVDVARAAALFGMASVHILPSLDDEHHVTTAYLISAGRAAALFAVLAGVGIALASGGQATYVDARLRGARVGLVARALLLGAIGLLLGLVDSPPLVILAYYAVLFLFAIPFLRLSARPLFALAVTCAVVMPVVSQLLRMVVSPTPIEEPDHSRIVKELLLTGTYPALTWTAYLFTGLAIGRLDLRRRATAAWLLVGGAVVAVGSKLVAAYAVDRAGGVQALHDTLPQSSFYAADTQRWITEGLFGTTPTESWKWLLISSPHSGAPLDLLHTSATAAAVIGLCLLLTSVLPRWLFLPLAATGSMTLTLYSLHVLALRRGDNPLLIDDPKHLYLDHVVTAIVVATLWRTFVGRGPLEALLAATDRSLRRTFGGTPAARHRERPPTT